MSDDALNHDEGASQQAALAIGEVASRAGTLHALGVLRQPVGRQDIAELITSHPWLIPGLNPSQVAGSVTADAVLALASGVAGSLDRLITIALVERSSLGTAAARSIRARAPAPRMEAIMRRSAALAGGPAGQGTAGRPHVTGCAFAISQLQPYLNGGVSAQEGAAIRDHLGTCVWCLSDYGTEAVMREIIARGNPEVKQGMDRDDASEQRALQVSEPAGTAAQSGQAPAEGQGHRSLRVLVLGGDGFCGWPTSLYLSDRGHQVTVLDNLSRRNIDTELEVQSLTPIRPVGERLAAWREAGGAEIGFVNLDLATEYDRLVRVLGEVAPDAIVHFAEQRAAPYSMRSEKAKRYTVDNNVRATHNLLVAMVASGSTAALAHLGTMGVYGYGWSGSAPIPEGYLTVKVPTPDGDLEREILHPANPGSVYHMTKTLDQLMFAFYAKNDKLRITDLHQGIVWGTQTDQTARDERLINRFDYDGDYGTVLNRFLMQAAIGHPLTVHGSGGQTRAFIHIKDTVRCIEIAITNPPQAGSQPMVLNQITETHRVADLAKMVADTMGAQIAYLPNPRQEADENDLVVRNDQFLALGLNPTTLSDGLLGECIDVARKYRHRADLTKIIARSVWRKGMETAQDLVTELPLV